MGTTAQKLQRVLDTKEGLKDTINTYLGQDITSAIPFKDYETYIKNFYGSLPKTSYAEGSNITLSNTLKGKLDFEDGIVGIGDISQKNYQGYQMIRQASFGTFTNNGVTFTQRADGSILVNGTTTSNGASINLLTGDATVTNNDNNITILPNQAYTLSGANDPIRVVLHTSSYSYVKNANTTFTETGNVSMSALRIIVPADTTINNVVVYPMLEKGSTVHDWEPYVGGTASPNPSYPQDIEVVRGKNRLPLNEADFTTTFYGQNVEIKDEVIKISGSATQFYSISIGKNGLVTPSDTSRITFKVNSGIYKYTQFASGTSYSGINVRLKDEDTNTMYTTGSTITLTETHTFSINIFMADTDSKNAEIKIQLEKGSQATSYLPYNTLEVVERGKNYFHLASETYTKQYGVSGVYSNSKIKINGTTTNGTNILNTNVTSIGTYKAGTYTFSTKILSGNITLNGGACAIYIRNSSTQTSETVLAQGGFNNELSNKEFTLTQDTELFLQIYCNASNVVFNNYEVGIQIEEGSSSTNFEEYITPQTYQLSLGEYEFAKIGNYVDIIEYDVENDKVYKNEKIGKYTFTGNENMAYDSGSVRFVINDLVNNLEVSGRQQIYSNRYKFIASGSADYGMFAYYNTVHQIFIYNKDYTNPSDLLSYFANNNTYFYYIRNNLNKIEITGTLKDQIKALYYSHSFTGTTIIEIDGQLPLIIKVRALKGE